MKKSRETLLACVDPGKEFYRKFLDETVARFPKADRYLDHERIKSLDLNACLANLQAMETGGFSHEKVGGQYGRKQLNSSNVLTRRHGYLALTRILQRERSWSGQDVLFDALAGNGTFDRMLQKLVADRPKYVGNDVGITMVRQALDDDRLVFYSDLRWPVLAEAFADYAVCAYGTHHVPADTRVAFAKAIARRLKPGGTVVIQDFIEGSPTARWYSECIDQYRSYGHKCSHFAYGELRQLLHDAGLTDVVEHVIYDPFVVRLDSDISDESTRGAFYRYLMELFALDRLIEMVEKTSISTRILDTLLTPYFSLSRGDQRTILNDCANDGADTMIERCLTIKIIDGTRYLVAPRVAIAAAGTRPIPCVH